MGYIDGKCYHICSRFPVRQPPAPQWYGPSRLPPCQQLPITYAYLLPAIPYYLLLPLTTYYYLLPTTNYYLPHTTPPHRGRGDWTMLLLLGYHDHGWGVGEKMYKKLILRIFYISYHSSKTTQQLFIKKHNSQKSQFKYCWLLHFLSTISKHNYLFHFFQNHHY